MWYRMTSRVLGVVSLTGCLALLAMAADKHEGKVVEASNYKLTMTDMDGTNQHSHMVATNAKVTRDGKTAKLDDLKKGDIVEVALGEQAGKEVAIEVIAKPSKDKGKIDAPDRIRGVKSDVHVTVKGITRQ